MLANQFFPKSVNKDPGKFIYFEQDVRASPASLELPRPCVAFSWIVGHFIFGGGEGEAWYIALERRIICELNLVLVKIGSVFSDERGQKKVGY